MKKLFVLLSLLWSLNAHAYWSDYGKIIKAAIQVVVVTSGIIGLTIGGSCSYLAYKAGKKKGEEEKEEKFKQCVEESKKTSKTKKGGV